MTADARARFATQAEASAWNELVVANPGGGEVWAGDEYLETKRVNGYRPYRVIVERGERQPLAVGVLAKRVPMLGEWWHVPAGPPGADAAEVLEAAAAIGQLARSSEAPPDPLTAGGRRSRRPSAFLLKIEPRLGPASVPALHAGGFRDAVRIVPNPSTVLVELDPAASEADVLAGIGKKARNSINRARRDGIEVARVPATDEHCEQFFRLLAETAEGRFVLRPPAYYREFWQRFARTGNGQMFFARRDGALIAGAYAMALGSKTTYKDGASIRDKSAYGASHALQWEVLRWAHERGATVHDLCGAPPSDRADDRAHPLFGVGQFKRSFHPDITDYAGAFDLPLKPWAYAVWSRIGDRLARRWSLATRKDPYY